MLFVYRQFRNSIHAISRPLIISITAEIGQIVRRSVRISVIVKKMHAPVGSAEDPGSGSVFTGKKGYPDLLVAAALDDGTELYSDKFMVRMIRKDRFTSETLAAERREVFKKEFAGRNLRYIRSG